MPWRSLSRIPTPKNVGAPANNSPARFSTICTGGWSRPCPKCHPQTLTGKALTYLHNQWPKLIGYLDDGRLAIDNNACERAIRPFVLGRRNWLFSDTPNGAHASANLYSIIETAKANGHEPYRYLRHLFTEVPKASAPEQIADLLPFNVSPADIPDP